MNEHSRRAQRFEVVDGNDRVRAVLGFGAGDDGEREPLLSLLDVDGRERVRLALTDHGPMLMFDQNGNVAVQLGVLDAVPEGLQTGAYVLLAAADGRQAIGWHVEEDGSVTIRRGTFGPATVGDRPSD